MTAAAQEGVLSFALQGPYTTGKIGEGNTIAEGSYSWHRLLAPEANFGPVQSVNIFPPEISAGIVPQSAFKDQLYFGGSFSVIPRLEKTFGLLALAAMGNASSVTGVNSYGVTTAGVNSHIFRFDPNAVGALPWLAIRRAVPSGSGALELGEIGFDGIVSGMTINVPNRGKLEAQINYLARDCKYSDPAGWSYASSTYESGLSSPDAGEGFFKIGGTEYPLVGLTIDFVNRTTDPNTEMIIGSYRPDTWKSLSRSIIIRAVYKYEVDDLERLFYTNSASGTEWSRIPFITTTSGPNPGVEALFQAPSNIAGSRPFTMRFRAENVVWMTEGSMPLQAGNIITRTFTGIVMAPANTAVDYAQLIVENAQAPSVYTL